MNAQQAGQFNHYVCDACARTTIALHQDAGVTPFMLLCRATPGCPGTATSQFYRGPQHRTQVPHVIWWRAKTTEELDQYVAGMTEPADQEWARDHHAKGGCLLRETDRSTRKIETDKAGW